MWRACGPPSPSWTRRGCTGGSTSTLRRPSSHPLTHSSSCRRAPIFVHRCLGQGFDSRRRVSHQEGWHTPPCYRIPNLLSCQTTSRVRHISREHFGVQRGCVCAECSNIRLPDSPVFPVREVCFEAPNSYPTPTHLSLINRRIRAGVRSGAIFARPWMLLSRTRDLSLTRGSSHAARGGGAVDAPKRRRASHCPRCTRGSAGEQRGCTWGGCDSWSRRRRRVSTA